MKMNVELVNADSFMFIPNEFTKDHELTRDEIYASLTPDPEYERNFPNRYHPFPRQSRNFFARITRFFKKSWAEKMLTVKGYYNRMFRGKLNYQISTEYIGDMHVEPRKFNGTADPDSKHGG